jgi:hypothetical protein
MKKPNVLVFVSLDFGYVISMSCLPQNKSHAHCRVKLQHECQIMNDVIT